MRTHTRISGIDPGHKRLWIGEEAVEYRDLVLAWGAQTVQVPVVARIAVPFGVVPGLIAALSTSVGAKVAKGDKLLMMEAMKMQTTVYAPCDGVVGELLVALGDTVESKDLLVRIRPV